MPDRRVLVTGASGFVGAHLVALCAQRGATVAGVGLGSGGAPAELDTYVRADLSRPAEAERAIRSARPDVVFHLAADASVARSWQDPGGTIARNVTMTANLLESVRAHAPEARVLVAGSGEVYGEPGRLPVTEDEPLRPGNPYAVSKAAVDMLAAVYRDAHGLHVLTTRAFNHAGPGQSDEYVVSAFARQIAEGEARADGGRIEIVTGSLEPRRDFTDVRDVVRAYWLAVERAKPGAYNVGSAEATAIADILAGLAAHSSLTVEQRTDPARLRPHEVMEIRASHDKLTKATGWEPQIPLERTLRDTLNWWRDQVAAEVAS